MTKKELREFLGKNKGIIVKKNGKGYEIFKDKQRDLNNNYECTLLDLDLKEALLGKNNVAFLVKKGGDENCKIVKDDDLCKQCGNHKTGKYRNLLIV